MVMQAQPASSEVPAEEFLSVASWLSKEKGEALLAMPGGDFLIIVQAGQSFRKVERDEAMTWLRTVPHIDQIGPQVWRKDQPDPSSEK